MHKQDLGRLIKSIDSKIETYKNKQSRHLHLTSAQIDVLLYLHDEGLSSMKALENEFSVAQPTMAGIIKRLHEKHLVTLETDPNDKRKKNVTLTAEADPLIKDCLEIISSTEENLTACLDQQEHQILIASLEKINKKMEEKQWMI